MLLRAALLLIASVLTAADFSGERALEAVKTAVAFGPRPAGSAASRRMQAWISRELKAQGWEVVEDRFTARTPQGAVAMTNLIARKSGLSGRAVAVISGHTDTKRLPFRFVGANDAGSSTGLLLELSRALKDERLRNDIWLVFFDGEEAFVTGAHPDSLYGSRHLADKWAADGSLPRLSALINVDMIGDRDLLIVDESNSTPALRRNLRAASARLGLSDHLRPRTCGHQGAPHCLFCAGAFTAIGFDRLEYGPNNPGGKNDRPRDTPTTSSRQRQPEGAYRFS